MSAKNLPPALRVALRLADELEQLGFTDLAKRADALHNDLMVKFDPRLR